MSRADAGRRRELAKIHVIARRQLGMDDDTYRAMLELVAGVRSAGELDAAGRHAVLDHLASLTRPSYPGRPHTMEGEQAPPELRKIEAFLSESKKPWSYADAIARRMFSIERLVWCTPEQLRAIIAALYRDARRHGRRTE
jgi:phage gp16-like protein